MKRRPLLVLLVALVIFGVESCCQQGESFNPNDNFEFQQPRPKVLVKGHVVCDRCSQGVVGATTLPLHDAEVGVKCRDLYGFVTFSAVAYTDSHGVFTIPMDEIPPIFGIKGCKAALIRGPGSSNCGVVSNMGNGQNGAHLVLVHKSLHEVIFTTGPFACQPSQVPEVCHQTPLRSSPPRLVYASPPPPPSWTSSPKPIYHSHPPPPTVPAYHTHPPLSHASPPLTYRPPPAPVYHVLPPPPAPFHHALPSPAPVHYAPTPPAPVHHVLSPPPLHPRPINFRKYYQSPPPPASPKAQPPPSSYHGSSPLPAQRPPSIYHTPPPPPSKPHVYYHSPPVTYKPITFKPPPLRSYKSPPPPYVRVHPPPTFHHGLQPPPTFHHGLQPPPSPGHQSPPSHSLQHSPPWAIHHPPPHGSPPPYSAHPSPVHKPGPPVYKYASPPPPKLVFGVKSGKAKLEQADLPIDNMDD